jgi:hypothetical protein
MDAVRGYFNHFIANWPTYRSAIETRVSQMALPILQAIKEHPYISIATTLATLGLIIYLKRPKEGSHYSPYKGRFPFSPTSSG